MTDSLTASMKWCRYDDDFKERNGYRLPAGKAFSGVYPSYSRHLAGAASSCHPFHFPYMSSSEPLSTDRNADSEMC